MSEIEGQETEQEPEGPYDEQLRGILYRLVAEHGRMRAADELDINYKTLARCIDSRQLTMHLRAALLTEAIRRGETLEEGEGESPAARVEALEGELRRVAEAVQALAGEVERLRIEHGERLADVEGRLAGAGDGRAGAEAEPAAVIGAPRIDIRQPAALAKPRRTPPAVVTGEAGPGDEDAYGEAWPLVEEWRALRARHPAEGKGLDWLRDEERLRELEIALIAEHELALAPARYGWDAITRRAQLRWRERTLERVRGERRRAQWRRRALTLGLRK